MSGRKTGDGPRKTYQETPATWQKVEEWFSNGRRSIGLVTGYGKIECLDFDDRDTFEMFRKTAFDVGLGRLVQRIEEGYSEATPASGVHWLYFCDEVRGSAKLAYRRKHPDEWNDEDCAAVAAAEARGPKHTPMKAAIETKGQGGFVIIAPSNGTVHPSGGAYTLLRGGLRSVATITAEEREALWSLARSFDETTQVSGPEERSQSDLWDRTAPKVKQGDRPKCGKLPGSDFNERAPWEEVLVGWTLVTTIGDRTYWRRPGKSSGWSASTAGHTLYVFTTSTVFEANKSYSKFGAYCRLRHGGDWEAAFKSLLERGYGTWLGADGIERPNPPPCDWSRTSKSQEGRSTQAGPDPTNYDSLSLEELGIIGADTIEPEATSWAWAERVVVGKINILAGEGSDGKSQLGLAIGVSLTTGKPLPDGSLPGVIGNCLILAVEDGRRDTILPRLIAAGADLARVKFVTGLVPTKLKDGQIAISPKNFQDLPYWESVFKQTKPCLLIADPIPAFLGKGVNDHRNNDVRAVLEPFQDLLSTHRVAMVGITHLGKATDQRTPVQKILGSVAYANLARTVHVTCRDPEDRKRFYLFHVKNNLGPLLGAMAYRIAEEFITYNGKPIRTSQLRFETSPVDADPGETLNAKQRIKRGTDPLKAQTDALWLLAQLKDRPQPTPLREIFDSAGAAGIVGKKQPDGKWSNPAALYRALGAVPGLKAPNDGWTVEEVTIESGWGLAYGRGSGPRKHWQACKRENGSNEARETAF
jgi:hypothetical protein